MYDGAARRIVKLSKWLLNSGRTNEALVLLRGHGLRMVKLGHNPREHELEGIVRHRIGVAEANLGHYAEADLEFQRAIETLPTDDLLARAITERDWGNSYLLRGDRESAFKHISMCRELLEVISLPDERVELEVVVTEGFMCRIDLLEAPLRKQALEHMFTVDRQLRGSHKLVYELDNLRWIIEFSPLLTRMSFFPRATYLNARMRNAQGLIGTASVTASGRIGSRVNRYFRQ